MALLCTIREATGQQKLLSRISGEGATVVIWKMQMAAKSRFRRLKAPEMMKDVYLGAVHKDEIAIEATQEKVAA